MTVFVMSCLGVIIQVIKKFATQELTVRTVRGLPLPNTLNNSSCVVILFDQRFQSTKTPVFVRNILNNRFASYFLFSHKDLIKYFSAKSHH